MNRTKIIVTYGPSLENQDTLKTVLAYTDVVRINFSHGNPESWLAYTQNVRAISKELGRKILLLADLPGPKIRIGKLDKPIIVKEGDVVIFSSAPATGHVPVEYKDLHKDAAPGLIISIGDGYLKFGISKVEGKKVICVALDSGKIESKKGINFKGLGSTAKTPTEEDLRLAKFALSNKFDWIAESFVHSSQDIKKLRKAGKAFIVAKIERESAISDIGAISSEANAIMVARGDLAFDIGIENVPVAQIKIINASQKSKKPVIIATQVLASMINFSMPTRAEVDDIANSVVNGANYIMLSDETAVGKYPLKAVETLYNTIHSIESFLYKDKSV